MPVPELQSMLTAAACALLRDRAFLRVTGEDRTRWLNGMVTNSAQALADGEGNDNFLLNAQGRIQGDLTLWRDGAEFLIETTQAQVAAMQQHLDRFIIMDDVELLPVMDDQHGLLIVGPEAAARMASVSLPTPEPNHLAHAAYFGQPVLVLAPSGAGRRFEVWSGPGTIDALHEALGSAGIPDVTEPTLEQYRILAAVPRFGQDIRDRDLPQETGQTHALHFNKGCYLGQEIVERIRSRGQVHRLFQAFTLQGQMPELPAALTLDGKAVGELTSAASVEDRLLALGYARREAEGQVLSYDGGTAIRRDTASSRFK